MLSWQLIVAILLASLWPAVRIIDALRLAADVRRIRREKRTISVPEAIRLHEAGEGRIAENRGDLLPGDFWFLSSRQRPDDDDLEWAMMQSGSLIDPSSKEERRELEKYRGRVEVMWMAFRD
jgi:hypothetical protein